MTDTRRFTLYRVAVLLVLAGLFAYYDSFRGAFLFDDIGNIVIDPNVGRPLQGAMKDRPVVSLSVTLTYWLDGMNTRAFHLGNLLIHMSAALTLFAFTRRTLLLPRFAGRFDQYADATAFALAGLWMLHPVQTQSVTYIVQRCESLMGLFVLLTFYCFVRGATAACGRWWYAAAVGSCFLATGCKELTLAVPVLTVVFDRCFLAGTWAGVVRRWRVHSALLIPPLVGIGYFFTRGVLGDDKGTVGFGVKLFTPWTYALTETEVLLYYLRLIAWPSPQCLDYIDWPAPQSLAQCWPTALGLGVLLVVTGVGVLRGKWWAFPAAWYFVILAPTSSVVPVQDAAFEHRLYLPLAGVLSLVVFAVVGGLQRLGESRPGAARRVARVCGIAAGGLMLVYGFLTVLRNEVYSSSLLMWSNVVDSRPGNYRARGVLAGEYLASGQPAKAEQEMRTALSLMPANPSNARGWAFIRLEEGQTAEAAKLFDDLVKYSPDDPLLRLELGICLYLLDRPAEACDPLSVGVQKQPRDKPLRVAYAAALIAANRPAEADEQLAALRKLDPRHATTISTQARRLALVPNVIEPKLAFAAMNASVACRLTNDADATMLDTLGVVRARQGRFADAIAAAEKAVALARTAGDDYKAERIAKRLELYRAKKPYLAAD